MAATGLKSGLMGTTNKPSLLLYFLFVLSLCVWTCNKKDFPTNSTKGEVKKFYLYGFGLGHLTLHSMWSLKALSKNFQIKANMAVKQKSQYGRGYTVKVLLVLLLLAGDIHLNPGPATIKQQTTGLAQNRAVQKQKQHLFFQTVNHARVLWDTKAKPKGILGGHLNIRSIIPKRDEISVLLLDSNLDYLCLSESWLHSNIDTNMIDIVGYQCFRKDRQVGRGGGVLIYIKEKYKCQLVDLNTSLECLAVNVCLSPVMNFNIAVVYNPPSHNSSFYNELSDLVKQLEKNRETIIHGDFNINWSDKKDKQKLKSLMTKFNYQQIIKGPTRITKQSRTLIDMVFTNKPERITRTYNLVTGLSDHNMVLAVRKLTKKRLQYFGGVDIDKSNFIIPKSKNEEFEHYLENQNWEQLMSTCEVDDCCNFITATITKSIEKFSKQIKSRQQKISLPWLNNEIRKLMKRRDYALKTSLTSKLQNDHLVYKSLRNKVVHELRKSKISYYNKLIDHAKGNNSSLWRHLNNLTNKKNDQKGVKELRINGKTVSDKATLANEFNSHFVGSVEDLTKIFVLPNVLNNTNSILPTDTFHIDEVNEKLIAGIVKTLSNSKTNDIYNMSTSFLKMHSKILIKPLTHLINLSIRSSTFPSGWKKAVVIPVHKSGSKDDICNYRPISILPVLSKVLEKVVATQLIDYLQDSQLLHPHQFGFRPGYSTETANCCLIENVKQSLDRGNVVGAVFLDLKKAFDTVNHSLLLSKMVSFNFSPNTLEWFASYLQNREQCVKVHQDKSSFLNNRMGIPQGSILGPLLFSIFINDLPLHCSAATCQLYADDAVIYTAAKTPAQAADVLSTSMVDVQEWLLKNHLLLNLQKTVSMCFSIKKCNLQHFKVNIHDHDISLATEFKYLGIVLDPQLKFNLHIKKISKTVKKNLNCFKLIRYYIPYEAAALYMHSMVFSHISYCLTVWAQAAPSTIRHIGSLYNQTLKILDKKPIRWHHCNVLKKYNLLSFESFIDLCLLKLTFKCFHKSAPEPLAGFVQRQDSSRATRSSVNNNCKIFHRRTTFGQTAFSIKGSHIWNTMPNEIKIITDFKTFTKNVKNWLKNKQECTHV